MGRIEVDEGKLDDVASEASLRCNILYTLSFNDYCDLDTDCDKCPFKDSESIIEWLRKESDELCQD